MAYTITLSAEEINVVADALGAQPLTRTVGVWLSIRDQVHAQDLDAANKAKKDADELAGFREKAKENA